MRLFVLDELPKRSAEYHADIHLRNSLMACIKIISDTLHVLAPERIQEKEYQFCGIKHPRWWLKHYAGKNEHELFPPPINKQDPWVTWASKNHMNAWWLVEYASQFQSERRIRFDLSFTNEYERMCRWVEDGFIRYFPKLARSKRDPLPFACPVTPSQYIHLGDKDQDIIKINRESYLANARFQRMKWTKRDTPQFFVDHLSSVAAYVSQQRLPIIN